jgi:hypothetical protein
MDKITAPDGTALADDPQSPVVLIGNSFAVHFGDLLVRDANLRIRNRWGNGHTTDAFAGFVREPETLDGVKVVIWVTADQFRPSLRPLPDEVMKALQTPGE